MRRDRAVSGERLPSVDISARARYGLRSRRDRGGTRQRRGSPGAITFAGGRSSHPQSPSALSSASLTGFNVGGVRDRLAGVPADAPPIRLAVLPFQNLTGDPDQEVLQRWPDRRDDHAAGPPAPGTTERDCAHVVDAVQAARCAAWIRSPASSAWTTSWRAARRREGNRVRISATLIQRSRSDAALERQLRAGARQYSGAPERRGPQRGAGLGDHAASAEPDPPCRGPRVDPEVYEAYLKGRFYWQTVGGAKSLDAAMSHFERAVQRGSRSTQRRTQAWAPSGACAVPVA